jgi:hypothetical protein
MVSGMFDPKTFERINANHRRKIGSSKEQARREQMAEQRANGGYDGTQDDEEEDYMEF